MRIRELSIPDVKILTPRRFDDSRGWFSETWNRRTLLDVGVDLDFCQENHSLSREAGTIRGVHFQTPPRAQDKLVRVLKGRIWDVVVDLRQGSPTYRKWVAAELSAASGMQILAPKGFGHGFCTLEPDTEVAYLVSDFYDPAHDAAVAWDDPDLAIAWPVAQPQMSDKDRGAPRLAKISPPF